jgi:AcrR family transcriptional regulator
MTQREIAEANASKVREAALDAFRRLGARVTMDDVADAAGVSKGTVYKTYASRQELVDAMTIWHYDQTVALIEQSLASGQPAREALLRAIVEPSVGPAAARLVMREDVPPGPVRDGLDRAVKKFEELFARGLEEGVIRPDLDVDLFIAMSRGLHLALPEDSTDRDKRLRRFAEVLIRGFSTPQAGEL